MPSRGQVGLAASLMKEQLIAAAPKFDEVQIEVRTNGMMRPDVLMAQGAPELFGTCFLGEWCFDVADAELPRFQEALLAAEKVRRRLPRARVRPHVPIGLDTSGRITSYPAGLLVVVAIALYGLIETTPPSRRGGTGSGSWSWNSRKRCVSSRFITTANPRGLHHHDHDACRGASPTLGHTSGGWWRGRRRTSWQSAAKSPVT